MNVVTQATAGARSKSPQALLGLALAAVCAAAWTQSLPAGPNPALTPESQAQAGVSAPRALLDRNEIRAQLMPRRYTTVAAEIGAKISNLPFVEGASFKAGEALVTFDCSLQKAQLDKSRAELVSAEHTLNSNERLTALKLDKARAELDSAEHMVSSHERRTALKLDKARAELQSAEHMVSSHERRTALKLDKARAELGAAEHTANSHESRTALKLDKARAELDSVQHTLTSNQRLAALNSVGQLELDLSRAAVSRAKAEVDSLGAVGVLELDLARAAVSRARAEVDSIEANSVLELDQARAAVSRAKAEVDSIEANSVLELDQARAAVSRAKAEVNSLEATGVLELDLARSVVSRARAEVGAGQAIMSKCSVAAPFNGRVAEQKARDQQFVQLGQPLLDIIDDSVLELEFLVPSAWLRWMRVGGALRVQIDETRKTYPARFIRVGARVDPVSQSIKVVAAIDGQHAELMAGMSGRVIATPAATGPRN